MPDAPNGSLLASKRSEQLTSTSITLLQRV